MKRELGMLGALVVICLVLFLSNADFLGQSNAINTLRQISMLGIYAIGSGFVIIAGGIDLSVGSVVGLTGVIIAKISSRGHGRRRPFAGAGRDRGAGRGAAHRACCRGC